MRRPKRNGTRTAVAPRTTRRTRPAPYELAEYDENRPKFPASKLRKRDGQWVAFNADATRIVASAKSLEALEDRLASMGEDPEHLTFERIELGRNRCLGAAELS